MTDKFSRVKKFEAFVDRQWSLEACETLVHSPQGRHAGMQALQEMILDIQSTSESVAKSLKNALVRVSEERNRLSPINRLPDEVLGYILRLTCRYGLHWRQIPASLRTCKHWYRLASRDPAMYCSVELEGWSPSVYYATNDRRRAIADSLAERSAPYPMSIFSLGPSKASPRDVRSPWEFEYCVKHLPRVRVLEFDVSLDHPDGWNDARIGWLLNESAPRLESLTLRAFTDGKLHAEALAQHPDVYPTLFGNSHCGLRQLHLEGLRLAYLPGNYKNLTSLRIFFTRSTLSSHIAGEGDILSVFRESPNLEDIELVLAPWDWLECYQYTYTRDYYENIADVGDDSEDSDSDDGYWDRFNTHYRKKYRQNRRFASQPCAERIIQSWWDENDTEICELQRLNSLKLHLPLASLNQLLRSLKLPDIVRFIEIQAIKPSDDEEPLSFSFIPAPMFQHMTNVSVDFANQDKRCVLAIAGRQNHIPYSVHIEMPSESRFLLIDSLFAECESLEPPRVKQLTVKFWGFHPSIPKLIRRFTSVRKLSMTLYDHYQYLSTYRRALRTKRSSQTPPLRIRELRLSAAANANTIRFPSKSALRILAFARALTPTLKVLYLSGTVVVANLKDAREFVMKFARRGIRLSGCTFELPVGKYKPHTFTAKEIVKTFKWA